MPALAHSVSLKSIAAVLGGGRSPVPPPSSFTPADLFANNEKGVWFAPSDFTRYMTEISTATMYQDLLRTTPVTSLEQPVATILDLAGPRSELGTTELITNGTFDTDTAWTKGVGWTISGGTAIRAAHTSITTISQPYAFVAGRVYVVTYDVVSISAGGFFPRITGGTNQSGATVTAAGSYSHAFVAVSGNATFNISVSMAGTAGVIDNVSIKEYTGQYAIQGTSAARPVLKQDANGCYYLQFDGTDDSMVTPFVDFTSTDSMSVFAGITKSSDVAPGIIVELSANSQTNSGAFELRAPRAAAFSNIRFLSNGTINSEAVAASLVAPVTLVTTSLSDISDDLVTLRVNGAEAAQSITDQGTGNYGNYQLYIGRRGGSTLPFNGRIYSVIVRGAASTAQEISDAETWVNTKTGAY